MKPVDFDYLRPSSTEEALEMISEVPENTKILAGGQSLMPMLNMRLVRPTRVVDINGITELTGISVQSDGSLRIGAMVRQKTLETDPLVIKHLPMLADAVQLVGHVQIRTRGTLGGSLAHADPAAELPALMILLDARLIIEAGDGSKRKVPARDFFLAPMTTQLKSDEILTAVDIDPPSPAAGWATVEVARVHGAFALAGAAALLLLGPDDRIEDAALSLFGVEGAPFFPAWLGEMAQGQKLSDALFEEIGARIRTEVDPISDPTISSTYRRRAGGELAVRALSLSQERLQGKSREAGA